MVRSAATGIALAGLLALAASAAHAQDSRSPERAGRRPVLPRDREIALARSAAPPSVADSAAVYVFTDSGYVLAETGTNGAACHVSRSWPDSLEPHCFDAEGAATIMKIHMREVELLHGGMTPEEAERDVGAAILSGELRLPAKPAVSYMMSAEQSLIDDAGRPVGRWRPHMMIYYPFLESGSTVQDVDAGMITGPGTAGSSILVIVPEFVPLKPPR